jgi:hypothetical protein
MGQASAANSTTIAFGTSGDLTVNKPNYAAWIIGGIIAILVLFAWLKGRK